MDDFKIVLREKEKSQDQEKVDFVVWLRDNYSTNKAKGSDIPLHKDLWRKDFSDEIFTTKQLLDYYNRLCE